MPRPPLADFAGIDEATSKVSFLTQLRPWFYRKKEH